MADQLSEHALPFVTVDEDDHFEVNPDAVAYLRSITGRVAIVSIAGLYRTGKSYLLNALTGNNGAFGVGPTVKPCTKGIWLWGKALQGLDGGDVTVLFMDTEGLGSTIRSETYDCRIFALALLLSSVFIYNSVGVIDGNAVAKLSLVVQLTRHIHVKSQPGGKEDSGVEFSSFFPSFMWVVRDFGVRLEKEGRRITSREYLEDALKPEDGLSETAEQKNAIRQMIRNFFPERDCVTLVRPVSDEKALAVLSSTPLEAPVIRPEFRAQLENLRKKLLGSPRPKQLYGRPLTGSMLAGLASAYVTALNTTGTPTISTAWDRVVDGQCGEAVEAGMAIYGQRMRELMAQASKEAAVKLSTAAAKTKLGSSGGKPPVGSGGRAGVAPTGRSATPTPAAVNPFEGAGSAYDDLYSDTSGGSSGGAGVGDVIVEGEDLFACHAQASGEALRTFAAKAVNDADKTPPYEAKLRDSIETAFASLRKRNEQGSTVYCRAVLDALYSEASLQLASAMASSTAGAGAAPSSSSTGAGADGRGRRHSRFSEGSAYDNPFGSSAPSGAGQGGTGGEDDGMQARVQEAASAVVSSFNLSKGYRTVCAWLQDAYALQARGPAQDRVLADFLLGRMPSVLSDAAARADDTVAAHVTALQQRAHGLSAAVAAARGREKAAAEVAAQDRKSADAALAEASRQAGETAEKLRATIAARDAELGRAADKFERLVASFEGANIRADEEKGKLIDDLGKARARLDHVQSERLTLALDAATAAARLAEAREAQLRAEAAAATAAAALAGAESKSAVLVERVRGAENETIRLREETELLYESNRMTKEILAKKQAEAEELEFQWGQAKAKLAQADSERGEVQAEVSILESLCAKAKTAVVKGKVTGKMAALDKLEQRRWDSLPSADR